MQQYVAISVYRGSKSRGHNTAIKKPSVKISQCQNTASQFTAMSHCLSVKIMRVKIPRVIKPLNSLVLAIIVIIIKIIHFIISGVRWVHFDGPLPLQCAPIE